MTGRRAVALLLLILGLLFVVGIACADTVSEMTARRVAQNLMMNHVAVHHDWKGNKAPHPSSMNVVSYKGEPVAYLVTAEPSGFLLIAYYDDFSPVLLYSPSSSFDPSKVDDPNAIESWIIPEIYDTIQRIRGNVLFVDKKIERAIGLDPSRKSYTEEGRKITAAWQKLSVSSESFTPLSPLSAHRKTEMLAPAGYASSIGPLLQTTWNQDDPYNQDTPPVNSLISGGTCAHALTGCVATAMAQVMKYWNWPDSGTGENSYDWNLTSLSASFEHPYDWADMPQTLSTYCWGSMGSSGCWSPPSVQKDAVAQLLSDIGISVNTNYGCTASSADFSVVPQSLIGYFKYRNTANLAYRADYGTADWMNMIETELNAAIPRVLLFSIHDINGQNNHTLVIDGYQTEVGGTDQVHLNYGGRGFSDGYYDITNNWAVGGTTAATWSANVQELVVGIEPIGYSITATAGSGGCISPSGVTTLALGGSQTYTITPWSGYLIVDVVVDGVSIGAANSYTFSNVTGNHTIAASFLMEHSISGSIYTAYGSAMQGVLMTLSGAQTATAATDGYGNYIFTGLADGSYTVTPTMTGYSFTPPSITVKVNGADMAAQNFTATITRYPATTPCLYVTTGRSVLVIDTSSNGIVAVIPLDNGAESIAVNPTGTYAYVTGDNVVSVIDTNTNSLAVTIQMGKYVNSAVVNSAGTYVYVTSRADNTISVIDTGVNQVVATIPLSGRPGGIAVDAAGTFVYVINDDMFNNQGSVSIIDTRSNSVTASIPAGSGYIAVNPAGTYAYVTDYGSVSVVDINAKSVISTIPVDGLHYGITINPAGTNVYVTDNFNNNVQVIDTNTNHVSNTIRVSSGELTGGIAVEPSGKNIYAATSNWGNTVAVMDASTNSVIATISTGNYTPYDLAVSAGTFLDVASDSWALSYINILHSRGITVGCGNGNYCPAGNVTRGQMAAFIIRALYGDNPVCNGGISCSSLTTAYFSDVPVGSTWFKYVQKMKETEITEGCGNGDYCPDSNVTRNQMAAFLIRAVQVKNGWEPESFTCSDAVDCSTTAPYFNDVPSTDPFFKYVQLLKEMNITTVTDTYNPDETVTRDQMAAFLVRAFVNSSTYSIVASSGEGGSITPTDISTVYRGSSQTYAITPLPGYSVSLVEVDGASVGAVSSYTFDSIAANHTISALFALTPLPPSPMSQKTVTYQINAAHSGYATFGGQPLTFPSSAAWSVKLSGVVSYPLISGGKVFVLTGDYPPPPNEPPCVPGKPCSGTHLYALDLATGSTVWGPVSVGFDSAGHAYDNGHIFIVDSDGSDVLMKSFDAESGNLTWSRKLPDAGYWSSAPPTATNGIVYVASLETFYAVDERDGNILWTYSTRIGGGDSSSPAVSNDGVFAAYPCDVYKFNPISGALLWHYSFGCTGGGIVTPVYINGSLYARDVIFDAATGNITGEFGSGESLAAIGTTAAFSLNGGMLQSETLTTKSINWSFNGDGKLVSPPIVIDQVVFVESSAGNVYAVSTQDGSELWTASAGTGISAPYWLPLTGFGAGEGYLVVPANDTLTAWRIVGQ